MYGFHKSRKDPSKNIFSHPFFLRSQPQLLHLVKRKIKIEEGREDERPTNAQPLPASPAPQRRKPVENIDPAETAPASTSKKSLHSFSLIEPKEPQKETVVTKTEITGSLAYLSYRSFGLAMEISPFKGLMEKSVVMDSNP